MAGTIVSTVPIQTAKDNHWRPVRSTTDCGFPKNTEALERPSPLHDDLRRGAAGGGELVAVEEKHLFQNRDSPVLTDYRFLLAGFFRRMYDL